MKVAVAALESIGSSQGPGNSGALWRSTLALLEELATGGVAADSQLVRLCARIDAQIRNLQAGSALIAEALMRDIHHRIGVVGPRPAPAERAGPAGGIILTRTIYDLYFAEARGHLDTLERELQSGANTPPTAAATIAADSLGAISDTIGQWPVRDLALALGRALARTAGLAERPGSAGQAILGQAVAALRRMSEAVALQRLPEAETPLIAALDGLAQAPPAGAESGAGPLDPSQAG